MHFSLNAVTGGDDAVGEATVKVKNNGSVVVGKGISTDILEASARAYVNAINRLVHDQQGENGPNQQQGKPEGYANGNDNY
jgi:2-isopropylmalate synthase